MAYQIEFTSAIWDGRRRRKALLRLALLTALAALAWEVRHIYITYNQPTLNMRLAEYESASRPVEEMSAAWDKAEKEYQAMLRYYRLVWAYNPTNFLNAMAVPTKEASRLGHRFRPVKWTLKTGGECRLDYHYSFDQGDKAEQAGEIEATVANSITSAVSVAGGKVEVDGVQLENLLRVESLNISARFSLPDARPFPAKEKTLDGCVKEIAAMRRKIQEARISDSKDARSAVSAQAIMMAYLPMGRDKPDFPAPSAALNVAGWFDRADQFIVRNRIPGDDKERKELKAAWNKVGDARFPWDRFRELDNEEIVFGIKRLGMVADGVKRFKEYLERRQVDCRKKLEPFVEAYERNDIFNKPLVESDLKDRVAKAAGIANARVSFEDEPNVEPATLEKEDETFTFTWVRWKLSVDGESDAEPLTLARLAECVRMALELGPGYVLDTAVVTFGEGGNLSGATLEGLLPVKKTETKKDEKRNVD